MPGLSKKSLIVGHFIQKLIGYGSSDSRRLLEIFNDHVTQPENTRPLALSGLGDVAIWDDRATVHRAVDELRRSAAASSAARPSSANRRLASMAAAAARRG